jgi:hypothetical protein
MTPQENIDASWRSEVNTSLKELLIEVRQRPTRTEIEALIATKVSADVFGAELKAIRADIDEIRQKPREARDWLGTIVTVGGCAISALIGILGIAIPMIILVIQHWH